MQPTDIRGVIVPVITPMHADETINEEALREQIDRLILSGVDGVFCLGTNGEAFALQDEEKHRVIRITVEQTAGRVPVYAGTGCITTRETIALSLFAREAGADVLSVITPSFASLSQKQLCDHYRHLADAVQMPLVIYNIPARTGVSVSPDLWAELSGLDWIFGIKDSSGDFSNMLAYLRHRARPDRAVLSGNDGLILWNLLAGGQGCVAGCANVYPQTIRDIILAFHRGDLSTAQLLQERISAFREVFRYGNPNTVVKAAVRELGWPVGECRAPFNGLSPQGMRALRQALDASQALNMR